MPVSRLSTRRSLFVWLSVVVVVVVVVVAAVVAQLVVSATPLGPQLLLFFHAPSLTRRSMLLNALESSSYLPCAERAPWPRLFPLPSALFYIVCERGFALISFHCPGLFYKRLLSIPSLSFLSTCTGRKVIGLNKL